LRTASIASPVVNTSLFRTLDGSWGCVSSDSETLRNASGKIRECNQHDFGDEKQAALETIERKIKSIISGKENNVIPITAGRKAA
jgi:hypothetical protein